MELKEEDAIAVKRVTVESPGRAAYRSLRFLFLCSGCGKEMWKQRGVFGKKSTGKCVQCSKRRAHKYQTLYNSMISSNERQNIRSGRDIPINLSFEEFLQFTEVGTCCYCNSDVFWREYGPGPYNLDRKDNSKGYEVGNLVVCCFECNYRKGKHWSHGEFKLLSDLIEAFRKASEAQKAEIQYAVSVMREDVGN